MAVHGLLQRTDKVAIVFLQARIFAVYKIKADDPVYNMLRYGVLIVHGVLIPADGQLARCFFLQKAGVKIRHGNFTQHGHGAFVDKLGCSSSLIAQKARFGHFINAASLAGKFDA